MLGLARAKRNGDRIGGKKREVWRGGAKMIVKREGKSFFNSDAAGADFAGG